MHFAIKPPVMAFLVSEFLTSGLNWGEILPLTFPLKHGPPSSGPVFASPPETDRPAVLLNLHEIKSSIHMHAETVNSGITGVEVFRVFIDEKGRYSRHEVVSSSHPLLRMACEPALPKARFLPAETRQRPVPAWLEISFEFER